eukprot:10221394-Prorocentrum_lima.AAC.1
MHPEASPASPLPESVKSPGFFKHCAQLLREAAHPKPPAVTPPASVAFARDMHDHTPRRHRYRQPHPLRAAVQLEET